MSNLTQVIRLQAAEIKQLKQTIADWQASFDLYHNAELRAIRMWQEKNPGNDMIWPDKAKLTVWLLEQLAEAQKMPNMLLEQSTFRLGRIQAYEATLEAVRNEFKEGYCFNRMDEAQRALRNIQSITALKGL